MNKKQKKNIIRIVAAASMMLIIMLLPVDGILKFLLYMVPYFTVGYDVLWKALKGIKNRRAFDEYLLMSVATVGAILLALFDKGDYVEAIAVMLFYQLGEFFQAYAMDKSRKNIGELMDIRPDYANIEVAGKLLRTAPDEVEVGTVFVVQPGEKIPLDGVIVEGNSTLNAVALTGESLPRNVEVGNEVLSGCINMTGVIKVKSTRDFYDSTASKILELVENASSRKAKSEKFITKFTRVYTPFVVYSAMILAVIPPLFRVIVMHESSMWGTWVYRALTFLVVSCPCALLVSIPLSFFAAIGGASRAGVLVKGANFLESLANTRIVVFDKTGTLTKGSFEVSGVHHNNMENSKLLEYAALAESSSSHPISISLKEAYGKAVDRSRVTEIEEISGCGVTAKVDNVSVAVGNAELMKSIGVDYIDCHEIGTIVHMAIDGEYEGHIVINDVIKPSSAAAIKGLRMSGVKRSIMLTGDLQKVADKVAEDLGVDEVYGGLLPGDKVAKLEKIIAEKQEKEVLVFVGDGINDAPVLSRADVGIAMGAMGSDAAIEAADVILMDDDPAQIVKAIRISRKCMRIVYENIWFSIGIKMSVLLLSTFGLANMWIAIFADVGVMVLAVLNAIRALFVKRL